MATDAYIAIHGIPGDEVNIGLVRKVDGLATGQTWIFRLCTVIACLVTLVLAFLGYLATAHQARAVLMSNDPVVTASTDAGMPYNP